VVPTGNFAPSQPSLKKSIFFVNPLNRLKARFGGAFEPKFGEIKIQMIRYISVSILSFFAKMIQSYFQIWPLFVGFEKEIKF
jgi:hypothetical protein